MKKLAYKKLGDLQGVSYSIIAEVERISNLDLSTLTFVRYTISYILKEIEFSKYNRYCQYIRNHIRHMNGLPPSYVMISGGENYGIVEI